MSDRFVYKSRVTTVRGRARAQLAAIRKDRLARRRTASGAKGASRVEARSVEMPAPEAARDPGFGATPAETVADGPDPAGQAMAAEVPQPNVETDDVVKPSAPKEFDAPVYVETAQTGPAVAESAVSPGAPDQTIAGAAGAVTCAASDVTDAPRAAFEAEAEIAIPEPEAVPFAGAHAARDPEPELACREEKDMPDLAQIDRVCSRTTLAAGNGVPASAALGIEENVGPAAGRGLVSETDAPELGQGASAHGAQGAGPAVTSTAPGHAVSAGQDGSDLYEIPGIGSALVWMLHSAGVASLADLARADTRDLADRLGMIARLLDLDYLVTDARNRIAMDGRG
jgi:predicted flap endonuclease-1-like 5' DNA nuclease